MDRPIRIWYVADQRLCNFCCPYCVSVGEYHKSNSEEWSKPQDRVRMERVVQWIGELPFRVGVRLATVGEPFASRTFLGRAAWLSTRPNIAFVELLTNGSLLHRRLAQLRREGDLTKISLWITHHHTEITVGRLIENARLAQEEYGCFVVVNGLLFPDNSAVIAQLRDAALAAGLRFNLDLGYDPLTPRAGRSTVDQMVPALRDGADGINLALELGADPELLDLNMAAINDLRNEQCAAGHDYFYIGINGDVYRCSRYHGLGKGLLGNILEDDFELRLNETRWTPCEAGFGCGNKEDFLNLRRGSRIAPSEQSLGWVNDRPALPMLDPATNP